MRYEAMGKARRKRLNIPQPVGGVNTATEAEFIDDDELAASCNLMIDHGTLRTREAVKAIGEEAYVTQAGAYTHIDGLFTKPIEVDGKMCVVSALGRNDNALDKDITLNVIEVNGWNLLMGQGRRTYTGKFKAGTRQRPNCAVAPYKKEDKPCSFLLYHDGEVYIPDDTAGAIAKADEENKYAPLVMINGRSVPLNDAINKEYSGKANGVMYEGYNRLTRLCRASYTPTAGADSYGYGEVYQLPCEAMPTDGITINIVSAKGNASVSFKNSESASFTLGDTSYTAKFFTESSVLISPALPVTDIANTVTITYVCF